MTDNRTNEPTEAQVEAAAKAMHETRNPWFAAYGDWGAAGFEIKQAFRESARAALEAAGVASQEVIDDAADEQDDLRLHMLAPQETNQNETKSGNNFVSLDHEQVAAQGAAPQAECDCGAGPGSAVCKKVCATRAPVLPSSAESPVEPFKTWFACWWKNEPNEIAESNAQSAFYAGWDARGLPSSGVDEVRAEAVREVARYINRIAPNGLVPKKMILADMEFAADRLGRGIHANGNDRAVQGGESRG